MKKLNIPGPEKIGGIHENISNPGGKEPNLTPDKNKLIDKDKLNTIKTENTKLVMPNSQIKSFERINETLSLVEISKKFPMAYRELEIEKVFHQSVLINNYDLTKDKLYNFFDARGILIEIGVDYTRIGYGSPLFCFQVGIFEEGKVQTSWSELYRNREDAEKDAFYEAFKLLDEELSLVSLYLPNKLYPGCEIKGVQEFYDVNNKWTHHLLYNNIDIKDNLTKRFSSRMQILFCIRQGVKKIQLHLVHEGKDCYPDYLPKELKTIK